MWTETCYKYGYKWCSLGLFSLASQEDASICIAFFFFIKALCVYMSLPYFRVGLCVGNEEWICFSGLCNNATQSILFFQWLFVTLLRKYSICHLVSQYICSTFYSSRSQNLLFGLSWYLVRRVNSVNFVGHLPACSWKPFSWLIFIF